eukprot:6200987-Pyramimonas_sp.AAC.1
MQGHPQDPHVVRRHTPNVQKMRRRNSEKGLLWVTHDVKALREALDDALMVRDDRHGGGGCQVQRLQEGPVLGVS